MLKTKLDDETWLIRQPDHAQVSAYLAAHWGGVNGFAQPGFFVENDHSSVWREEVVFAAAQHDNGWWEWEADPGIDPRDGLPYDLADDERETPQESLARWRTGVERFTAPHPYAALLMSLHPTWLYRFAFDDLVTPGDEPFRHPLFSAADAPSNLVLDESLTRAFIERQAAVQDDLSQRLRASSTWAAALDPASLYPHLKLLQHTDAMSLLMCFGGRRKLDLAQVPRAGWDDRVTLRWRPCGAQTIALDPYPFSQDPLIVSLPARVLPNEEDGKAAVDAPPIVHLHAAPFDAIRFELRSV